MCVKEFTGWRSVKAMQVNCQKPFGRISELKVMVVLVS